MDVFIGTIVPWPIQYAPPYFAFCNGANYAVNQNQAVFSLIGNLFGGQQGVNFNLPDLRGRTVVGAGNYLGGNPVYNVGASGGAINTTFALATNQVPQHTHAASFVPTMGTQSIVIPGSTAAGSLGVNVTGKVNSGAPPAGSTATPGGTVYLGGLEVKDGNGDSYAAIGPYSSSTAGGATLGGLSASVTPSADFRPATSSTTVGINTVTGGSVAIMSTPNPAPVVINNMQPWLAMNFLFCLQGLYPMRP